MSWNAIPTYGSANWQGNATLVTKNQLLSSISGLYNDIQDIELSTITVNDLKVSTLTAQYWISTPQLYAGNINTSTLTSFTYISTPELYVSTIIGGGASINNGTLSISTGDFALVQVSSLSLLNADISGSLFDFTLDLGLGSFLGGLVGEIGGLLAGGIGVIVGGIALGTSLAGSTQPRNNSYINTNTFETVNGTTQLQISTLGNAYPNYSSIIRLVSSTDNGQFFGMGVEKFVSTIFPAGSKCIRSVGDPLNLPTAPTSSIQSFGQWVPFSEAEPDNVIANNITANNISSGLGFFGFVGTDVLGVASNVELAYNAPITFETGAYNNGRIVGSLNNLYIQSDTGIIFTQPDSSIEAASLYLGNNAYESIFNISSINSLGNIKTVDLYASTITAEQLNVISTFFLTSTNVEFITSTQTLVADNIFVDKASIREFISAITFTTTPGNSNSPYDINKTLDIFSTSHDSISSITNNVLNYQMNVGIQEETSFNMGFLYNVSPSNIEQWGSTIIYFDNFSLPGSINLGWRAQWAVSPGDLTNAPIALSGATFDVYASNASGNLLQPLTISENSNASVPFNASTFVQTPAQPPAGSVYKYRFTLPPAVGGVNPGWWTYDVGFAPYASQNSNSFTISQDINDVWIRTTDRLNLEAGDINFIGQINLSNINVGNIVAQEASIGAFITPIIQPNSTWGPGSIAPNLIEMDYNVNIGTIPSLASTNTQIMNNADAGYINNYTGYISTVVDRPTLNLSFGTANELYLGAYGATGINAPNNRPDLNWAKGTIVFNAPDALTITMVGYGDLNTNGYILNLSNAGAVAANLTLSPGVPGVTSIPPGVTASIRWNQTFFFPPEPYVPWTPYTITDTFQINQFYQNIAIQSSNVTMTGNQSVTGTLQVVGQSRFNSQITTMVPSLGYAAIEIVTYNDAPIWTFVGSPSAWDSAAQNLIPRASGGYYRSAEWTGVVSVRGFTTPDTSVTQNSWTAYTVNQVVGGVDYLALFRYLQIIKPSAPSAGTFDVTITLYPKNFTTNI